jgi:hypothetical protein
LRFFKPNAINNNARRTPYVLVSLPIQSLCEDQWLHGHGRSIVSTCMKHFTPFRTGTGGRFDEPLEGKLRPFPEEFQMTIVDRHIFIQLGKIDRSGTTAPTTAFGITSFILRESLFCRVDPRGLDRMLGDARLITSSGAMNQASVSDSKRHSSNRLEEDCAH